MADQIREEITTYLKSSENISKSLSEMRNSAKTEEEKEANDRLFLHHMIHVMSETEPSKRRDSVSSEKGSNDVVVNDEITTTEIPIYDEEGNRCGVYKFFPDGKAKCFTPETGSNDVVVNDEITTTEIPIYDKEGNRCGVYKFFRTTDGKAKCSEDDCKNLKIGSLQTLKCHALKKHNIRLDVKKRKAVISEAITCNVCHNKFTRRQTLASHQQKYHQSPVPVPSSLSVPVLQVPESQPLAEERGFPNFTDTGDLFQGVFGSIVI